MPCFKPRKAWLWRNLTTSKGKALITFSDPFASPSSERESIKVPCGRCVGCLNDRAKSWAVRCYHESTLHERNCFITLTFSDDFLNKYLSLKKSDFVLFMKRLRKKFGEGIRFFHCGEYGSKLMRPHHHACLFNFDFEDKYLWTVRESVKLYRSESLERLWSKKISKNEKRFYSPEDIFEEDGKYYVKLGYCTIGEVTFESAAYVARYCLKKVNGVAAHSHYGGRVPEYVTMSRRPGLGKDWIKKFVGDVYPQDLVIVSDRVKVKPPKYYDFIYDVELGGDLSIIKESRKNFAVSSPDNTDERLAVREKVATERLKLKGREYENSCI